MTDTKSTTKDLTNGWFATLRSEDEGETLTVRNPELGQRIELGPESVALLCEIVAGDAR